MKQEAVCWGRENPRLVVALGTREGERKCFYLNHQQTRYSDSGASFLPALGGLLWWGTPTPGVHGSEVCRKSSGCIGSPMGSLTGAGLIPSSGGHRRSR